VMQLPETASEGQLLLESGHSLHLYDKVVEADIETVEKISPSGDVLDDKKTLSLTVSCCSNIPVVFFAFVDCSCNCGHGNCSSWQYS